MVVRPPWPGYGVAMADGSCIRRCDGGCGRSSSSSSSRRRGILLMVASLAWIKWTVTSPCGLKHGAVSLPVCDSE
jgi:hypothetical protein